MLQRSGQQDLRVAKSSTDTRDTLTTVLLLKLSLPLVALRRTHMVARPRKLDEGSSRSYGGSKRGGRPVQASFLVLTGFAPAGWFRPSGSSVSHACQKPRSCLRSSDYGGRYRAAKRDPHEGRRQGRSQAV